MTDLLPCPFCGDSAVLNYWSSTVTVLCTNCNARSCDFAAHSRGEQRATEAWNTRSQLSGIVGERDIPCEPTEAMLDASWKLTGESREMRPRTHAHYKRHWLAMFDAALSHHKQEDRSK